MSNLITNPFYIAGINSAQYERYTRMFGVDEAAKKLKKIAVQNLRQEAIDMHPDHNNGQIDAFKEAQTLEKRINGFEIDRTERLLSELLEPFQTQLARALIDLKTKYAELLKSKKILFKTFANWLTGSTKDSISSKAGIFGPLKLALINKMPWNEIVSNFKNNKYVNLATSMQAEICPYQLTIEEDGSVVFNSLTPEPEKNKAGAKTSDNEWLLEFDNHESSKKHLQSIGDLVFTPCFKVSKNKSILKDLNIVGSINLKDIYAQVHNQTVKDANNKAQVVFGREEFKRITGSTEATTISINNGKIKLPVIATIDTENHLAQYAEAISNKIVGDNYLLASYLDSTTNSRKLCILGKIVDFRK